MTKKTLAGALLLGLGATMIAAPALANDSCLEFRHIKVTHMVDPTTMVATNIWNDRYTVRFTGACKVGGSYTWNHFVYTDLIAGKCLQARSVLPTSSLGPCFVESVTPVENGHS